MEHDVIINIVGIGQKACDLINKTQYIQGADVQFVSIDPNKMDIQENTENIINFEAERYGYTLLVTYLEDSKVIDAVLDYLNLRKLAMTNWEVSTGTVWKVQHKTEVLCTLPYAYMQRNRDSIFNSLPYINSQCNYLGIIDVSILGLPSELSFDETAKEVEEIVLDEIMRLCRYVVEYKGLPHEE